MGESQANTTIGNTQANATIDESEANAIIDDTHDKGEKIKTPVTRKVTRSSSRNARKIDAMKDDSLGLKASDTRFSNVIDSVKLSRNLPRRSSRASVPR